MVEFKELEKEFNINKQKAERFDSLKVELDVKIEEVNKHLEAIQDIIKFINPSISIKIRGKRVPRDDSKYLEIAREVVKRLKETGDFIFIKDISNKYNIEGGMLWKVNNIIKSTPGIKVEFVPGYKKKLQYSWVGEVKIPNINITEQSKKQEKKGEGYIDEESGTKLPKKFSYMK